MAGQMVLPVPGVIERDGHPRHSSAQLETSRGTVSRRSAAAPRPIQGPCLHLCSLTSSLPQESPPHDSHSFISNILHQRIPMYFCLYLGYALAALYDTIITQYPINAANINTAPQSDAPAWRRRRGRPPHPLSSDRKSTKTYRSGCGRRRMPHQWSAAALPPAASRGRT